MRPDFIDGSAAASRLPLDPRDTLAIVAIDGGVAILVRPTAPRCERDGDVVAIPLPLAEAETMWRARGIAIADERGAS